MTAPDRRLARLEAAHDTAQRASDRTHRARLAQFFRVDGDPRENSTFAELAPEARTRWAWLFDTWRDNAETFVNGVVDARFAPEPRPVGVCYTPPPEE